MTDGPGTWAIGLAGSVLAHLGAGAVLLHAAAPQPLVDQPVPQSRLQIDAYQVDRADAAEVAPEAPRADLGEAAGTQVGQGAIAQSAALPASPPVSPLDPVAPKVAMADAAAPAVPTATPARITSDTARPAVIVASADLTAAPMRPVAAAAAKLTAVSSPARLPPGATAIGIAPDADASASIRPTLVAAPSQAPASEAADPATAEVTQAKATLAFPGAAGGPVDPVSLAAFQSFMQPGDLQGDAVRDGLEAVLGRVPCARMQVSFIPETNTLRLSGHVPEDGLRAPVLAALQAQMGQDIAVSDNLLILPRPQCGALAGIAQVGLPQSTDQITNPLIVGEDTHAREFRYVAGQQLVLDLVAPDYDAFVYVDYFDADGQVIHLSPNDTVPLAAAQAKAPLQIGARAPGDPGLFITIGPPFGQEIAVAFAASVPLYDGVRPLVEPAAPYLGWMQERVAEARAADPAFKGEWVYFFVSTSAE